MTTEEFNTLDPISRAHELVRLKHAGHLSDRQLAEQVGVHQARVSRTIRLLELPTEVQAALAERRISRTTGEHLALLIASPSLLDAAAKDVLSGRMRLGELRDFCRTNLPRDEQGGAIKRTNRRDHRYLPGHPKRKNA